ncbi:MAG TPA: glycosyltransferase family 39 protein [Bryobacteraceae bacterium]|nr:glycosyltransferase family 39 protein [Bryobacteraceae bacterium]
MAPRHFLIFVSLLALFLLLAIRNVSPEPYAYDEADYMYAARFGFAANWSDTPSISVADFLRAGLHRGGAQPLSDRIRGSNDVLFYRHFHGPLLHYFLIPVSRLAWSERAVRSVLLAIPAATLAVIYFGCLWLSSETAALLAAMLFLTSHAVLFSSEIAPHQLFALCSVACLILLMKAIATKRRAYWYGSVAAAGLAFCTLEVGFVLVLSVAICGWIAWRQFLVKSLCVFLATVLVVWPAAILRLSFLKSSAAMAYLATMRQAPWGQVGFIDTWRERIFDSPLEWALIAIALLAGVRSVRGLYPLWIFAALMIAATLRVFTTTPRYSLTFLPVLDVLAGLTLLTPFACLRRPASFAVVTLAVAGLYGNAGIQASRCSHNSNPRSTAVLTFIHQNELENKALLAPRSDVPALHFYFPAMRLRGYAGQTPSDSERAGFAADAVIPAAKP